MKRAVLIALALVVLAVPANASAIGWTTPIPLSPSITPAAGETIETRNVQMAVNSQGTQVITWDDITVGSDTSSCVTGEARTRVPGADWSPTTEIGCSAQIKIGPNGTAVAIWEGVPDSGTGVALRAATAPPGQSFGAAQDVDVTDTGHISVATAIDPTGRVSIAWHEFRPCCGAERYDLRAKTQNADGTWPASSQLVVSGDTASSSGVNPYYGLVIAAGTHGDVVIAADVVAPLDNPIKGQRSLVAYTRLTPTGSWSKSTLLGPNLNIDPTIPIIAADGQDRITVAVSVLDGSAQKLYAWTRPADTGTWPALETVGAGNGNQIRAQPGIALDSQGNAQVVFLYSPDNVNYVVRGATRAAGSTTWLSNADPTVGPTPCNAVDAAPGPPSVTFDATDGAAISFDCSTGPLMFTRAKGSSTYATTPAPPGATDPIIVTDPNGYLISTWTSGGVTYSSVYDAVAPSVDSFTAPTSPVAGEPATFTVTGSDTWGPVTYSVDFGDGTPPATGRAASRVPLARATGGGTVSHTYTSPGNYTATVSVNDNASNSSISSVPVAVAAQQTGTAGPGPVVVPGLPDPVAGVSANVAVVRPVVKIKQPGSKRFVPLTAPAQIRMGSLIDTRRGRVRITIANALGRLDTADFYAGLFKLTQPKLRAGQRWFANLYLFGASFKRCPVAPRHPRIASASRKKGAKGKSVRKLWGSGGGAFRTVGRFSSATVRGTTWLTNDYCNGTLTKVTAGKVGVRDFVLGKTILLRKGKSYFARANR